MGNVVVLCVPRDVLLASCNPNGVCIWGDDTWDIHVATLEVNRCTYHRCDEQSTSHEEKREETSCRDGLHVSFKFVRQLLVKVLSDCWNGM